MPGEEAFGQYAAYCRHIAQSAVPDRIEALLERSGNARFEDGEAEEEVWRRVLRAVESGTPLSLVRLGDGEGNLIFWGMHRGIYPELAQWCLAVIWRIMFGGLVVSAESVSTVLRGIERATLNADYLGIPWREDISAALAHGGDDESLRDVLTRSPETYLRGQCGYLAVWDALASHSYAPVFDRARIATRRIHETFLQHAPELIRAAGNVSLITCYPQLLDRIQHAFGVAGGETILIPPEGGTNVDGVPDDQLSSRYAEIVSLLSHRDVSGRLFFVGAGLPGKEYCDLIKSMGGMAIDAGSMLDVWSGKSVRPYQTEEFVRRFAFPN